MSERTTIFKHESAITVSLAIGLCITLFTIGYNWKGVTVKFENHDEKFAYQESRYEAAEKRISANQLLKDLLVETKRGNKRQ